MENMNINTFLDTLTEEQKSKVLACKTEDELEQVLDDYDIEIPDEMLEDVAGGKGFVPMAMAAILAFTIAGATITATPAMSISVSAASSDISDMSDTEKKAAMKALSIVKDTGISAINTYMPGGAIVAPLLNGILGYFMEVDDGGPTIADVQKDISDLRDRMDEQFNEIKKGMDSNTQKICDTVENAILLGSNGARLSSMKTTTDQLNLLINTKQNKNISNEEKLAYIASRIGKSGDWSTNSNLIFKVIQSSKALSGEELMLATSDMKARDGFMTAYKLACNNAMFSGDAYDAAAPFANYVMNEYFNSFSTAMECLMAAREVAQFTPEQVASLSADARADYNNACHDVDLIDSELIYLIDMALNADKESSVISHYTAFMYAKDHNRNVFVDMNGNGDGVVISPTLVTDSMSCGMPSYADYYFYSDFENRFNSVKDETLKSVKNAANKSEISPSQIEKIRKLAYSKGMSFNAYLNSMGINTNYGSNCYFPISDVAYSSGDKVAHKGGAPSKDMRIYMKTFDASSRNNDSTSKEVYNIHSWNEWRNRIETEYWSCVSYNKDAPSCKMLLFKAGSELSFPTTATQIMNGESPSVINEKSFSACISYRVHVQDIGWQNSVTSNGTNATTAGTTGRSLRMEGIKIDLKNKDGSSAVQYRAYVQNQGWQGWHNSGELAGTEGQGLRMEALEIKLTGDYAESYDVVYRAHCEDMGWTGWVKNGQTAGTTGQSLRMEAVEIKLVPKS